MLGTAVTAPTLICLFGCLWFFFFFPVIKLKNVTHCGMRTMNYADVVCVLWLGSVNAVMESASLCAGTSEHMLCMDIT